MGKKLAGFRLREMKGNLKEKGNHGEHLGAFT